MIIKCAVIEDEPLAQDVLRKYIEDVPFLRLSGMYNDPIEAQPQLHTEKPDLVFLDINLPVVSGINFLKTLTNPPLVIFTTAYQDFALDGFELNAIDYLLKPFSFERFIKAVNKASERLQSANGEKGKPADEDFLFIKVDKKLYRIAVDDIIYLEALDDYVKIKTISREYLTNNTLKSLQDELPANRFIRVHKSFIISLSKIDFIEGNYIKMQGKEVPVGAVYKDELVSLFRGKRK